MTFWSVFLGVLSGIVAGVIINLVVVLLIKRNSQKQSMPKQGDGSLFDITLLSNIKKVNMKSMSIA